MPWIFHLRRQTNNELLENEIVNILPQLQQQEPIAELAPYHDIVQFLLVSFWKPIRGVNASNPRTEDHKQAIDNKQTR